MITFIPNFNYTHYNVILLIESVSVGYANKSFSQIASYKHYTTGYIPTTWFTE